MNGFRERKMVAILGPKGTFCDKAYEEYDKKYRKTHEAGLSPVYCATIDDVFDKMCQDQGCRYGIVPVENMLDGYVQRTLDLLLEKEVYIIDENQVAVQFMLVGNVSKIEDIKKIYVQFKANGQCRDFLHTLQNVEIIRTESNMESYYKLGEEPGVAAIVPKHLTELAGKHVLLDNVTDAKENYTRFLIFQRGSLDVENPELQRQLEELLFLRREDDSASSTKKVRIPVYIMPATDRPGILFDILRRFYEKRINLISIMSRPTRQAMGTYNFYIEIDCPEERLDAVCETLRQIQVYNDIKILGAYWER